MKLFTAKIYKVGINAAADVPGSVTGSFRAVKGYIRVTGTINGFAFRQTLVPVKDAPYRLYVNIPMLKGSGAAIGDTATFALQQDNTPVEHDYPMHPMLEKRLTAERLEVAFAGLTSARRKDILKYLDSLRTETSLQKNIDKVIGQLKDGANARIP